MIFTYDLEDYHGSYLPNGRYVANANAFLDWLAQQNRTATFFTIAQIATAAPHLIRRIVSEGHELACHGLDHTPIDRLEPASFSEQTARAQKMLEDASGSPVLGYRAPIFSLVERTRWAAPVLRDLGFTYSSSVLPAASPLYGWPGAPELPFRWPDGLLEFPCPVGRILGRQMPLLGGTYLRLLPLGLIRRAYRQAQPGIVPWTYLHPYDHDTTEPVQRVAGLSWWVNRLLFVNRASIIRKITDLSQMICPESTGTLMDASGNSHLNLHWDPARPANNCTRTHSKISRTQP